MQVSVLSGLVQSDLDPWNEAADLSRLSRQTAVERLAVLIEQLPDVGSATADTVAAATRLVALLPGQVAAHKISSNSPRDFVIVISSQPWWLYVMILSVLVGSQFLAASHQIPLHPADPLKTSVAISAPVSASNQ